MQHLRFDLSRLAKGSTVVVKLKGQANVQLMTNTEYNNYKAGRRYRYLGGRVTTSPFRIRVPSAGHWVVAIDLGGYPGSLSASVAVEPPPRGFLPDARSNLENPASRVIVRNSPDEPPGAFMGGQTWDVFVSHASEDKQTVASPLRDALTLRGVTVWLDEAQLRIGDSLRQRIDNGIRSSRFGVVILSESYFGKGWTNHELDGLITRTVAGEQSLLPIWFNLDAEQVRDYSPSLADKVALSTAELDIDEIAERIAEVVQGTT